jgi:hypothetical protein
MSIIKFVQCNKLSLSLSPLRAQLMGKVDAAFCFRRCSRRRHCEFQTIIILICPSICKEFVLCVFGAKLYEIYMDSLPYQISRYVAGHYYGNITFFGLFRMFYDFHSILDNLSPHHI